MKQNPTTTKMRMRERECDGRSTATMEAICTRGKKCLPRKDCKVDPAKQGKFRLVS